MIFERHSQLLGDCFERLRDATFFVAGAGGLGSTVLTLLARLGVGNLYFADFAKIDEPDLNRQLLYNYADLGKSKTEVATKRLREMNPWMQIHPVERKLDEDFELPKVDAVIDCLDSFAGKFLLDRLCEKHGLPLIHAGVEGYSGQVTVVIHGKTPSLRALFHGARDENKIRQVFPSAVVLAASIQVSEAIKVLCQRQEALINKILFFNLLSNRFEVLSI